MLRSVFIYSRAQAPTRSHLYLSYHFSFLLIPPSHLRTVLSTARLISRPLVPSRKVVVSEVLDVVKVARLFYSLSVCDISESMLTCACVMFQMLRTHRPVSSVDGILIPALHAWDLENGSAV